MAKKNNTLIPKKEGGTPKTLTEIGDIIRNKSSFSSAESTKQEPKVEEIEEIKEIPQEPKNIITKKKGSSLKLHEVLDLMEEKEYLCKATLYIDTELHEVLTLLKTRGKISMSKLASYILEEFILENREEIEQITENKNRYLSRKKK